MKYLLELNQFGDIFDKENNIDEIIKKLKSSGYISRSTKDNLEKIIGVKGIVEEILLKSKQIVDFYDKHTHEFFDDLMLEFFDDTPYNYSINIGINMSKDSYIPGYKYDDNGERLNIEPTIIFYYTEPKNYAIISPSNPKRTFSPSNIIVSFISNGLYVFLWYTLIGCLVLSGK